MSHPEPTYSLVHIRRADGGRNDSFAAARWHVDDGYLHVMDRMGPLACYSPGQWHSVGRLPDGTEATMTIDGKDIPVVIRGEIGKA